MRCACSRNTHLGLGSERRETTKVPPSTRGMSLRKDFSSLRKRIPSGLQPKNRLKNKVFTIGVPDQKTINKGAIYVVDPQDTSDRTSSSEMKTCYFLPISITETGLADDPLLSLGLLSADYNGSTIDADDALRLIVSKSQDHIALVKGDALVDKLAIPRGTIKSILFSDDAQFVLIVLQKKFGYFYLHLAGDDSELLRFFQSTAAHWGVDSPVDRVANLRAVYLQEHQQRIDLTKDPKTLIHIDPDDSSNSASDSDTSQHSDSILRNGLPTVAAKRINTRSTTKSLAASGSSESVSQVSIGNDGQVKLHDDNKANKINYNENDDEPEEQEVPAPFDPPLKHALSNGKTFTITYNDFKTLYNNDWINDTIIDFFIAYEIDKSISEHHYVAENEVYAFNSFFFTKLMSKPDDQEGTPDYYGNIKRWLGKIDLMSYESVIIPINECLHWYCLVIRNLPRLLRYARRQKVKDAIRKSKTGVVKEIAHLEHLQKKDIVSEVFVFDSLRHKHPNIEEPLRAVIDKYCQEKHGIEVPREFIKFVNARVPRQTNFNDCGIHVICNVEKWLRDSQACEQMWRKASKLPKGFFGQISERKHVRKALIDLLLELQRKQSPNGSTSVTTHESDESDGEIELISYHTSKPEESKKEPEDTDTTPLQPDLHLTPVPEAPKEGPIDTILSAPKEGLPKSEVCRSEVNEEPEKHDVADQRKTLDPHALSSLRLKATSSASFLQIEHPQVRRLCMRLKVKLHTIAVLNEVFDDHTRLLDNGKERLVVEFVQNYNFFDPEKEKIQSEKLRQDFRKHFKETPAPMDEPFVIHDADDSGGELNRSVGELTISNDSNGSRSRSLNYQRGSKTRTSRERTKGIEILDDELQILTDPETSISESTPRKKESGMERRSRGRGHGNEKGEKMVIVDDDEVQSVFSPAFSKPKHTHGLKRRRVD